MDHRKPKNLKIKLYRLRKKSLQLGYILETNDFENKCTLYIYNRNSIAELFTNFLLF